MKCIKLFQKGEEAMAGRNGKFRVSLIHKILGHTEALIRDGHLSLAESKEVYLTGLEAELRKLSTTELMENEEAMR